MMVFGAAVGYAAGQSPGTFAPAGLMTAARSQHADTLLLDAAVLTPAPTLLSITSDGRVQGATLHAGTESLVTAADPAMSGEALEVYCTGLADGSVISPHVTIGGYSTDVLFFGNAPGFPGLNQIDVRVPEGLAPGPAIPVRLNYLDRPSNVVTIAVQQSGGRDRNSWFGEQHQIDIELQGKSTCAQKKEKYNEYT